MKVLVHAALGLAGQDRDQARIDAARDIGADRHVAAQMNIDRVVEQFGEPVLEIPGAVIEIDLDSGRPNSARLAPRRSRRLSAWPGSSCLTPRNSVSSPIVY